MAHMLMITALVVVLPLTGLLGFFALASFDYFRGGGSAATTTGSNDDLKDLGRKQPRR